MTGERYDAAKRAIDVAAALLGLALTAPLSAVAAAAIKLSDGGPVFYRGTRIGRHGRPFAMLKFRSMVVDATRLGGSSTAEDDPRLTRVGRLLRRFKLDELPQLVNVLRGEMSLVGPRPQVGWDVERYTERERALLTVRPGITDWASVLFRNEGEILAGHADVDRAYDELIRPRKIELGLSYVERRGLGTDLRILALTARVLLQPARADALVARALPTGPFRAVTETAGTRADADQLAMARLRHSLVAFLARDGDLLDVACGSGYALPLIAAQAHSVTACDLDATNLAEARAALPAGAFCRADAQRLPFRPGSFDVVACLEAVYYFADQRGFLADAARLLRPGGTLVTTWPNPARPAFHRSPNSTEYPTAMQLTEAAEAAGFDAVCYGAFPLDDLATARRPWLDALRRWVVRLGLIPGSLRLRMLVKRVLYRGMRPLGELSLTPDPFAQLVKVTPERDGEFTMLYLVATRPSGGPR